MILFIEEGMMTLKEAEQGDELEGLNPAEAEKRIAELMGEKDKLTADSPEGKEGSA